MNIQPRPDQKKFDQFIEPLFKYDSIWKQFELHSNYTLEINSLRKPGRILRKEDLHDDFKISYIIELYMEPIWYKVEYSEELPYTFALCAFYDNSTDMKLRWRVGTILEKNKPLNVIGERLVDYIEQSFIIIDTWSPDYVRSHGKKIELPKIFTG